jgi:nitrogen fixation/metabolism regulation signal transduction histidine kinase
MKRLYVLTAVLLMIILTVITAGILEIFYDVSPFYLLIALEALIGLTAAGLLLFYRRVIRPLHIIASGMDLLREQDFSSRLRRVGQPESDRIADLFNRMMEQLKNERLHLREQHHFLDLLVNASPLGVVALDADGLIMSANPAAYRLLGIPPATNLAGKPLEAADSRLATELAKIEKDCSRTIRLSDANIYKCTHSSFADRGFRRSFFLLELLTEEVFKAEMKAYKNVIRMIVHEVNNTMAGMISTLDTLIHTPPASRGEAPPSGRGDAPAAAREDAGEVLRIAIERCYGMSRFVSNFAAVVRIPEPQLCATNLNEWLISVRQFMESICRNRNISIVMEECRTPLMVKIDRLMFEQTLVNIIKNAAESIERDGHIYIRTGVDPLRLEIADTGRGIDVETESRLFTPFFSTKPHGQGLGLIFIRETLLKHGCTFSLRTCPDGLTRFMIFFGDAGD